MDVELTELEKLEVTRVDAVGLPANGFPVLMMKGLAPVVAKGARDCPKCDKTYDADHQGSKCENCGTTLPDAPAAKSLPDWHAEAAALVKKAMVRGKVDESADIDGGQQAIALVGKLIGYEAQELAAGNLGEVADIGLLADAAALLRQWVSGESAVQDGNVMPATTLMQSAAEDAAKADLSGKEINDLPDSAFAYIEDGGTKDSDGKTTPRSKRHFPVHDEAHARNALSRAPQSPFGDKAMPKIKAAAKKFGIGDGDTAKSAIAQEGTDVDTVTQETGGLSKAVEDAVTKAIGPLKERITALDAELAKVKAAPVPGGPVLSRNVQAKQPGAVVSEDMVAKAAYYREQASLWDSQDRATAEGYRLKAREADAKAVTPTS